MINSRPLRTLIIVDKDILTDTSRVDKGESRSLNQGEVFDLEQAQVVKVSWNEENEDSLFCNCATQGP